MEWVDLLRLYGPALASMVPMNPLSASCTALSRCPRMSAMARILARLDWVRHFRDGSIQGQQLVLAVALRDFVTGMSYRRPASIRWLHPSERAGLDTLQRFLDDTLQHGFARYIDDIVTVFDAEAVATWGQARMARGAADFVYLPGHELCLEVWCGLCGSLLEVKALGAHFVTNGCCICVTARIARAATCWYQYVVEWTSSVLSARLGYHRVFAPAHMVQNRFLLAFPRLAPPSCPHVAYSSPSAWD
jgi:hypothetical protein